MMKLKRTLTVLVIIGLMVSFSAMLSAKGATTVSKTKMININTAQADAFTDLPRIGEKIAQRIVDFRKKHGKFKRLEDLMKVKGIGEKTFNRFKKRLRL